MTRKPQYHLHYVEGCTPKVKSFKTEGQVNKFLAKWINKYSVLDDNGDNWIDCCYYGIRIDIITNNAAKSPR